MEGLPAPTSVSEEEARALVSSRPWHHSFEVFPGVWSKGNYEPHSLFDRLGLPDNLSGQRVIDVGASDGFFVREMHRRGADVLAVDYRSKNASSFGVMERCYGREIPFKQANIYDLPAGLGPFDIVVCLGVLYHLPDMLRGLHILHGLTRRGSRVFVESYQEDFGSLAPLARYTPGVSLAKDFTNFWAPNIACVKAMMTDAGFIVDDVDVWGDRCLVRAISTGRATSKFRVGYGTIMRRTRPK